MSMSRRLFAPIVVLLTLASCGGETVATTTTTVASTTTEIPEMTSTTRSDASVTIDVPSEVGAGTEFTVAWTGPDNTSDYITIVAAGAAEGTYLDYFYTRDGAEGPLTAPTEVGDYEIRYIDGATEATVHSVPISVVASPVTLTAPDEVEGGAPFQVTWSGPDGPGDFVTVVPAGSPVGFYESYFYTRDGSTGTLVPGIEPGVYEIRYVGGDSNETFHSVEVTVVAFVVTLEAPAQVEAGVEFEVTWTGPDGPQDYITIVPAGSPVGTYLDYEYTTQGSPLSLTAPEDPGQYEIRYVSDREPGVTFFSIPIEVG
jgi:Ca-activated chloride channel family protein